MGATRQWQQVVRCPPALQSRAELPESQLVGSALLSCSPASWWLSQLDGRCCDLRVSSPQAAVNERSFLLQSLQSLDRLTM